MSTEKPINNDVVAKYIMGLKTEAEVKEILDTMTSFFKGDGANAVAGSLIKFAQMENCTDINVLGELIVRMGNRGIDIRNASLLELIDKIYGKDEESNVLVFKR